MKNSTLKKLFIIPITALLLASCGSVPEETPCDIQCGNAAGESANDKLYSDLVTLAKSQARAIFSNNNKVSENVQSIIDTIRDQILAPYVANNADHRDPSIYTRTNEFFINELPFIVEFAAFGLNYGTDSNVTLNILKGTSDHDNDGISNQFDADFGGTTDDDIPGNLVASKTSIALTEGGSASDTVFYVLSKKPKSDVEVTISALGSPSVAVSTSSLTFTASNWNFPQTVTVYNNRPDDNLLTDADGVALIGATDRNYTNSTVSVSIGDDDGGATIAVSTPATSTNFNDSSVTYVIPVEFSTNFFGAGGTSVTVEAYLRNPNGVRISSDLVGGKITGITSVNNNDPQTLSVPIDSADIVPGTFDVELVVNAGNLSGTAISSVNLPSVSFPQFRDVDKGELLEVELDGSASNLGWTRDFESSVRYYNNELSSGAPIVTTDTGEAVNFFDEGIYRFGKVDGKTYSKTDASGNLLEIFRIKYSTAARRVQFLQPEQVYGRQFEICINNPVRQMDTLFLTRDYSGFNRSTVVSRCITTDGTENFVNLLFVAHELPNVRTVSPINAPKVAFASDHDIFLTITPVVEDGTGSYSRIIMNF